MQHQTGLGVQLLCTFGFTWGVAKEPAGEVLHCTSWCPQPAPSPPFEFPSCPLALPPSQALMQDLASSTRFLVSGSAYTPAHLALLLRCFAFLDANPGEGWLNAAQASTIRSMQVGGWVMGGSWGSVHGGRGFTDISAIVCLRGYSYNRTRTNHTAPPKRVAQLTLLCVAKRLLQLTLLLTLSPSNVCVALHVCRPSWLSSNNRRPHPQPRPPPVWKTLRRCS
jgi:hypothetical protein